MSDLVEQINGVTLKRKPKSLWGSFPNWPRGMTAPVAAAYLGLSERQMKKLVKQGKLPKPIALSAKKKIWLRDDLDGWLDRSGGQNIAMQTNPWLIIDDQN